MAEVRLIDIKYDGTTEKIHCEKVSENIYKCLESCLFIDFIKYGCEIEIEDVEGELNFLGLYKESSYNDHFYVWSKEIIESKGCEKMKEEIIKIGGYWESAMGGVFIIHLPKEKSKELDRLLEILADQQRTEP